MSAIPVSADQLVLSPAQVDLVLSSQREVKAIDANGVVIGFLRRSSEAALIAKALERKKLDRPGRTTEEVFQRLRSLEQ